MAAIKGGDKLRKALDDIAKKLDKGGTLSVGFLENATYPDGTPVALVAASNEYGTDKIPARPFFRDMIAAKSDDWPEGLGQALVANDYDAEKALKLTGDGIKGQLQQSIVDFVGAPLAKSTVKAKGTDKQLVDTGHMLNSVDYEVTE